MVERPTDIDKSYARDMARQHGQCSAVWRPDHFRARITVSDGIQPADERTVLLLKTHVVPGTIESWDLLTHCNPRLVRGRDSPQHSIGEAEVNAPNGTDGNKDSCKGYAGTTTALAHDVILVDCGLWPDDSQNVSVTRLIRVPFQRPAFVRGGQDLPSEQGCHSETKQPESGHHPSEGKHRQGPDRASDQRPQERPTKPTLATIRETFGDEHAEAETSGRHDRSSERDRE